MIIFYANSRIHCRRDNEQLQQELPVVGNVMHSVPQWLHNV